MATSQENRRVLAIAPFSRGFGYAVVEDQNTLVNWGMKRTQRDKNAHAIKMVRLLIRDYDPEIMALEDVEAVGSLRRERIRILSKEISSLASERGISVMLFSQVQTKAMFLKEGAFTKHELAKFIADRFSDELSFLLPDKRRPWDDEDQRMTIFVSVALALMVRLTKKPAET